MAGAERLLSYSLLSLISSKPFQSTSLDQNEASSESESDEEDAPPSRSRNGKSAVSKVNGHGKLACLGLANNDGAWCWRDDCAGEPEPLVLASCGHNINSVFNWADCLRLTKCMQKTAETLQGVADLYDDHVRFQCLPIKSAILSRFIGEPSHVRY